MKPLLCNKQVVQNILAGRQTQDRRPIKFKKGLGEFVDKDDAWQWAVHNSTGPKYQVGDVLYVREAFWQWGSYQTTTETCNKLDRPKERFAPAEPPKHIVPHLFFQPGSTVIKPVDRYHLGYHKRPSIFMPKELARIFLKVTAVRVERIQDISLFDAASEGILPAPGKNMIDDTFGLFIALWNSLYPGSWERNDWVFVYEFERCEKPK